MRKWVKIVLVTAIYLGIWQVAAMAVHQSLLLPWPLAVGRQLVRLVITRAFWNALFASIFRVTAAFMAGAVLGTLMAALTSRFTLAHTLLAPALAAIRATPVSSFIILALVWMGASLTPVFAGIIIALPIFWGAVTQGIQGRSPELDEIAQVFSLSPMKKLRYIYLPQAAPAFAAACSTSLGLTWKAVIAAEVLGTPKLAMGTALHSAKIYLQSESLLAWTLVVVLLSMIFEKLFSRLLAWNARCWGWGGVS